MTAALAINSGGALAAGSGNSINDRLLSLSPAEQAKTLANNVGQGCLGLEAFPMGVTTTGKAQGFAYWSLRCQDGRSFAVQIQPNAAMHSVDCRLLKENGIECFTNIAASRMPAPQPPSAATTPTLSSGSGFFISAHNDLITNLHVVERCRGISAYTASGKSCSARITAQDPVNDLALLTCDLPHPLVPQLRLSARVGEDIVVYGFPLSGMLAASGNVTAGNITALAGIADDSRLIQLSAPVQPGNSGGPVLDRNGNVVGVVVSKLDVLKLASSLQDIPENVNFGIKSSVLEEFLHNHSVVVADIDDLRHPLSTADIADRAKAFTVRVECLQ